MAEVVWECLIISITLLFGINIGLGMGLTSIHKKEAVTVSVFYGVILMILSMAANLSNKLLYGFTSSYIPEIMGIVGCLTLLGGICTVSKWRKTKDSYYPFSSVAMWSASICCFVGFGFLDVLLSREITLSFLGFSVVMALGMIVLVTIFYLFSKILRNAERPYPVLFGNFMILNGLYFLMCAFFIPNIKKLSSVQGGVLSISSSISTMIFMIMACIGVILVGVYLKEENIRSLEDIYQKIRLLRADKTKKSK